MGSVGPTRCEDSDAVQVGCVGDGTRGDGLRSGEVQEGFD